MISVKYQKYIDDISKISEIFWRFFQNIDGPYFDFLTIDLMVQIGFCFDPIIHISSTFLKASNGYFFYPTIDFKAKLDLTVHFQLIYDDPTVRFQSKLNPMVIMKSQLSFYNPSLF